MNDLEKRVAALEDKVKVLEETLETLKNMGLSEEMDSYIKKKSKTIKMMNLLNTVSEKPAFDLEKEEKDFQEIQKKKSDLEEQITEALTNTKNFPNEIADDLSDFEYEKESGIEENPTAVIKSQNLAFLSEYKGKGIRITGYNGINTEKVVIPSEINGLPVVSIGEKAFINGKFNEIVIPNTVKAILNRAFEGCENLKDLIMPDSVVYLGTHCFIRCGFENVDCSENLDVIPRDCFSYCKYLRSFNGGSNIRLIESYAFSHCESLDRFMFHDKLEEIEDGSFSHTKITFFHFPPSTKRISDDLLKGSFFDKDMTIVVNGKETEIIKMISASDYYRVNMIYCFKGSKAHKYARENKIPVRFISGGK